MYAEDENSLPRKDNTDTNVALDTQHDAGESPLRRSKRISHLPNQPKYKLSDYYRNMNCDELSKCSDDYAHGSEEDAFGGFSDPESINTYTYISSGDDNDETHGSTVKKEPTVHVKMESNTSQGDLDESATRGDRVEQELVDETSEVDCDANASNQDVQQGQGNQEESSERHADGQGQEDNNNEVYEDGSSGNRDEDEVQEVIQQEELNGLNLLEENDNEQQLQEQHDCMERDNRNRERGQTSLDYSFQFAVHKTD